MEIPSSHAGVVKEMKVKVGDKVSEGSVLLMLEAAEAGAAAGCRTRRGPAPAACRRHPGAGSSGSAAGRSSTVAGVEPRSPPR